jgi:hypothetical protein
MTRQEEQLIEGLRALAGLPLIFEVATVVSCDSAKLTCVIELMNETQIPDVRLKASFGDDPVITDGLVQIPTVGSSVIVAMIGNNVSTRFVAMFSRVDEVVLFNGENGGVPKVVPLVQKLNAIEDKINDVIDYINGHSHPGHGSAPTPTYTGGNLSNTDVEDLENTQVKH